MTTETKRTVSSWCFTAALIGLIGVSPAIAFVVVAASWGIALGLEARDGR